MLYEVITQPAARIDALAPPWVAPLLEHMPELDEVIAAPFAHGALALGARWRVGRSLRARAYDQAIVLPNSWKSALVPLFAGIALRSGYVGEARYGLLTLPRITSYNVCYTKLLRQRGRALRHHLGHRRLSVVPQGAEIAQRQQRGQRHRQRLALPAGASGLALVQRVLAALA